MRKLELFIVCLLLFDPAISKLEDYITYYSSQPGRIKKRRERRRRKQVAKAVQEAEANAEPINMAPDDFDIYRIHREIVSKRIPYRKLSLYSAIRKSLMADQRHQVSNIINKIDAMNNSVDNTTELKAIGSQVEKAVNLGQKGGRILVSDTSAITDAEVKAVFDGFDVSDEFKKIIERTKTQKKRVAKPTKRIHLS